MTPTDYDQFGTRQPFGVNWDGSGVNVAVYSEAADSIEFCLFDDDGNERCLVIPENSAHIHHGYFPGVSPGQRYGFRVHGEWNPERGVLSNHAKLLLDPYSRAIDGEVEWASNVFAHVPGSPMERNDQDSAPNVPRSVVVDNTFDWGDDAPLRTPWTSSVIYETHVRGLTMTHPEVPAELRGTYAGMASTPIIEHLVSLGITAVELMPVQHFVPEGFLAERGLTNYWGYATAAFLAPHGGYSSSGTRGEQVVEFKQLVRTLHTAGIEVIMDVVYNHTTEGALAGPTLSLRGLDNTTYYRVRDDDPSTYVDYTGTGNSLNVDHPASLQLVMDSLRYWADEMHVDGFRFDLAFALARTKYDIGRRSSFLDIVHQDPVLNSTKLIAEPWDVGPGGYQLGHFPPLWSEWNAAFRDDVRDYWDGSMGALPRFAMRFAGSSDLYDRPGRRPWASINFVTSHDGFTLQDLVSYDHRHNEANKENNRDGHPDMRSWNGGEEGDTDDTDVLENRRRRRYSMLATLLLSQGVPMICGGDELGRTQRGNNNAYCQDNDLTWYDWTSVDAEQMEFVKLLIDVRHHHPVFRRGRFFAGVPALGGSLDDIGWFRPDGSAMENRDWEDDRGSAIAVFLNGNALRKLGPEAGRVVDRSFLMMSNPGQATVDFTMPEGLGGECWRVIFDTADLSTTDTLVGSRDNWIMEGWSMTLLERDSLIPVLE